MEASADLALPKFSIQANEYSEKGAYHWKWYTQLATLRYRFALRLLPRSLEGEKCLDFGGGDGYMASKLAGRGGDVVVFDPVHEALAQAKEKDGRVSAIQGMTHIPFAQDSFSVATCLDTLEHIPDGKEQEALAELYRVLKKDGRLVVSVPSIRLPLEEKHHRHYTPEAITEKMKLAGFTVENIVGIRSVRAMWPYQGEAHRIIRAGLRAGFSLVDRAIGENSKLSLVSCLPDQGDSLVVLARK